MASLRGLTLWAQQNQAVGHALIVNVGGANRCATVEMVNNRMAGGQTLGIRFICDGYCGLPAKHPSKQCKTIDKNAAGRAVQVPPPPGLVRDTGSNFAGSGAYPPAPNTGFGNLTLPQF